MQSGGAAAAEGAGLVRVRHGRHSRTTVAIVYGTSGDPDLVLCDAATDPPGQRWFTVVLSDATGPDGRSEAPVCVDCLLDVHPALGRAGRRA